MKLFKSDAPKYKELNKPSLYWKILRRPPFVRLTTIREELSRVSNNNWEEIKMDLDKFHKRLASHNINKSQLSLDLFPVDPHPRGAKRS
tara:strand:+ start:560 stop:826 length:267 start_codon:yes stop_codon:yes gene_type:complete